MDHIDRHTYRSVIDRGRSRPAQAPAPTDARTSDRSNRESDDVGHAFVQNLRRGHYDLGTDARRALWVAAAFTELAEAI
jgi:IS6 family transposase